MTSSALFPRLLAVLFFLSLALLSYLLNFNGLYGQDAHEYLRQSRAIFDRLHGLPMPSPSLGDAEFAGGYPMAGALLRFVVGDAMLALQIVSWLAAAFGLWLFVRLLTLLSPGARTESLWAFAGLVLMLAPMFFRSGLTCMSEGLGLLFVLAAFFFGLRAFENRQNTDAIWAAAFGALAVSTRYSMLGLMLPLAAALANHLLSRKKWLVLLAAVCAIGFALQPHFWLKTGGAENPFGHTLLQLWSPSNFFQNTFSNENGLSRYPLPNILYLLFPIMHPAFCLALPGLFFLFKKTDLALPAKKILFTCLAAYLLLLGGIPHQNPRHLLPAYVFLLLIMFPAWDRFYCYGFIFFRRLTMGILLVALVSQIICCAIILKHTLARHTLEHAVAAELKPVLPPNATVFAFDLDVALRSYLPDVQFRNLWERRYEDFPSGSFVLFNESLRPQWQGLNPILNWDFLRENHRLELKSELPNGWGLWEIR